MIAPLPEDAARAPGNPERPGHHGRRACREIESLLRDVKDGRRMLNVTIVVRDEGKCLDCRVVDIGEGVSRRDAVLSGGRSRGCVRCCSGTAEVVLTDLAVEVLVEIKRAGLGRVVRRLRFFLRLVVAAALAGV